MRSIIIFLPITFLVASSFAQVPVKKEIKTTIPDETPSKKQIRGQMAGAINELNKQVAELETQLAEAIKNKADAETIKDMEEQLSMLKKQVEMMGGINKKMAGISDNAFQQTATSGDNVTDVPRKDVARIRMIPDRILSDAELAPFVKKVHAEIDRLLPEKDKTEALKIFTTLTAKKATANHLNNIASTLWLSGYTEMALYILGKACIADMSNANNLNNYGAFLTMAGAEHAALPILQNLNRNFPGNSTILNNIGQAWFGLGDINNANRHLDDAVRIYKNHSQANQTKSQIQKSQGQTQESVESLKRSMEENYTTEKEAQLNELGYEVKFEDIKFKYPVKAEPLGIEQFIFSIPGYPYQGGAAAQISRNEWDDFRQKLRAAIDALGKEIETLKPLVDTFNAQLVKNPMLLKPYNTHPYKTANRKLTLLITQWGIDRIETLTKRKYEIDEQIGIWRNEYKQAIANVEDCGARKELATAYLSKANPLLSQWNGQWMSFNKQAMNMHANLTLYTSVGRANYLLSLAIIKQRFLIQLAGLPCEFEVGCLQTDPPPSRRGPLPDFDSVNCQYKEEIFIPPFTNIKIECNKMTTEFDVGVDFGPFAVNVKAGLEDNLNSGKITKATLELGADGGYDEVDWGPLKAEAKIQGAVGIEINQNGVQEIYGKAGVVAELGVGATGDLQSNPTINTGIETKISWNAGDKGGSGSISGTLTGQGVLKSINIAGPKSN